ncbi:MAG: hypothetical protein LBM65_05860 [Oscillospiraceae bacterium]|nr:hypothetical protein [Oscillospiraceae bacterium]
MIDWIKGNPNVFGVLVAAVLTIIIIIIIVSLAVKKKKSNNKTFGYVDNPQNPFLKSAKLQYNLLKLILDDNKYSGKVILFVVRGTCILITYAFCWLGLIPLIEQHLRNILIENYIIFKDQKTAKKNGEKDESDLFSFSITFVLIGTLWLLFFLPLLPFYLVVRFFKSLFNRSPILGIIVITTIIIALATTIIFFKFFYLSI